MKKKKEIDLQEIIKKQSNNSDVYDDITRLIGRVKKDVRSSVGLDGKAYKEVFSKNKGKDVFTELVNDRPNDITWKIERKESGDVDVDDDSDDEANVVRGILLKEQLEDTPKIWEEGQMPLFLYRGVKKDTLSDSLKSGIGVKNAHKKDSDEGITFLSTSPEQASLYVPEIYTEKPNKEEVESKEEYDEWVSEYEEGGEEYREYLKDNPLQVIKVCTKGLDPKKFYFDKSATTYELSKGAQYYYDGYIPQETVEIEDSAGNTRQIQRLEAINFLSDRRTKTIVRAIKKRFI